MHNKQAKWNGVESILKKKAKKRPFVCKDRFIFLIDCVDIFRRMGILFDYAASLILLAILIERGISYENYSIACHAH